LGTFAKEEEDREPMQISQAISSISGASIKDSVVIKTTVPQQQPEHRPTTGGFQDDFDFDVEHPNLRQTQPV
jgi:hypothetical protein